MGSFFHGLEIGKRSLFAQQSALSTTGHNIANANTKGYSRQRVDLETSRPLHYPGMNNDTSPLQMGTGVTPSQISRLREEFLDMQYRGENRHLGYWEARTDTYTKIEEILNEPSESGLQKVMDQFWQSWEDLSKNPESLASRAVVRQRGVAVSEMFLHISHSLDQIEIDLSNVVQSKLNDINSIATQIKDLNGQISRLVPHGQNPNDLYDKRDILLDDLSKMVDVEVRPGRNGSVDVLINNQPLVAGSAVQTVMLESTDGTASLTLGDNPLTLTSGELLGLMEAKGMVVDGQLTGIVPNIRKQIDQLAAKFAAQINEVHQQGLNADDIAGQQADPNAAPDQLAFFINRNQPGGPIQRAADMAVHPQILESLNKIAAAQSMKIGDGTNAQKMASLKFISQELGGQTSTLDDYYRFTIAQLGIDSQESKRMRDNTEVMMGQVDNRRQSVSGVSLDEEMTNMVKFQQAYNAAARYVTTIDEVLDRVINGMGRVGL
jgi:flagellar hook-associated protein 1 FlgK